LGANQTGVTVLACVIIAVIVIVTKKFSSKSQSGQNLYLTVQSEGNDKINIESIVDILKQHCEEVHLRRFDETKEAVEASFLVELIDFEAMARAKTELQALNKDTVITFLDNKGLI